MPRLPASALLAALLMLGAGRAGAATSLYSDLYGSHCKTVEHSHGARTRRCDGVAGFRVLVHEVEATTSVDIVTPRGAVWPLDYWDVVTPGLARVGRKAEWRVERRGGALVPVALLVRLDTAPDTPAAPLRGEPVSGPRMSEPRGRGPRLAGGTILTAARIAHDGACVVYQGNGALRNADAAARNAVAAAPRCLGVARAEAAR